MCDGDNSPTFRGKTGFGGGVKSHQFAIMEMCRSGGVYDLQLMRMEDVRDLFQNKDKVKTTYNCQEYNERNTHLAWFKNQRRGNSSVSVSYDSRCSFVATFDGTQFFNGCNYRGKNSKTLHNKKARKQRVRGLFARVAGSEFGAKYANNPLVLLVDGVWKIFSNTIGQAWNFVAHKMPWSTQVIITERYAYVPKDANALVRVGHQWLDGWGQPFTRIGGDSNDSETGDDDNEDDDEDNGDSENSEEVDYDSSDKKSRKKGSKRRSKSDNAFVGFFKDQWYWFIDAEVWQQCLVVVAIVVIIVLSIVACYCCCCAGPSYPYNPYGMPAAPMAPMPMAPVYDMENPAPRRQSMVPERQWPPRRSSRRGSTRGRSRRSSRRSRY